MAVVSDRPADAGFSDSLKAGLTTPGILRSTELVAILEALTAAYRREVPGVRSVLLFGGITLGEFHPPYSDVDLAVVFDGEAPGPRELPEAVRRAVAHLPVFADAHLNPKNVAADTLEALRDDDWRAWAAETADSLVTATAYPFTLCDTWQLHHHGLVLAGPDSPDAFPFKSAAPTHPQVELAQVKRYAEALAHPKPLGGLAGLELLGEVTYYGTTFTRALYTLRTGRVIGRVASTRWYRREFGGDAGAYAEFLGDCRVHPDLDDLARAADLTALWGLFSHYARQALAYAAPARPVPEALPGREEFSVWLRGWVSGRLP